MTSGLTQKKKKKIKKSIIARRNIASRTVLHTDGMLGSILQSTNLFPLSTPHVSKIIILL